MKLWSTIANKINFVYLFFLNNLNQVIIGSSFHCEIIKFLFNDPKFINLVIRIFLE